MRILTMNECTDISAARLSSEAQMMIRVAAGLLGGIASGVLANAMGPLATFVGTPAAAIGLGVFCTPFAPVVGTVLCGVAGGIGGYFLSSTFATTTAFVAGGAASVFFVHQQMNR